MKKSNRGKMILLFTVLMILLTGCGTVEKKPLNETVQTALTETDGLIEFPKEELEMIADITPDVFSEYVYLASEDGISAREVIALRAKDKEKAKDIQQKLTDYLERRKIETRDYLPDEYQLLNQAKVEMKNVTVALIVGKNAAKETESLMKQE